MAMKDWKKSIQGRSFRRDDEFILISRICPLFAFQMVNPPTFKVDIQTKKETLEKIFKTKPQALKYAEAYMGEN